MVSPEAILDDLQKRRASKTLLLVGIDGPGGTGKTTLAKALQLLAPSIGIVHMDDFDLPSNGKMQGDPFTKEIGEDTDWRRLLQEVILPLREGRDASYAPFDRETGKMGNDTHIRAEGIVVVEGVFSLRKELYAYYDCGLWLTCSLQERLKRALERDGEKARERWEKDWLPMEERYIAQHKPHVYAHRVINTEENGFML